MVAISISEVFEARSTVRPGGFTIGLSVSCGWRRKGQMAWGVYRGF